jgi:hypothetical protein
MWEKCRRADGVFIHEFPLIANHENRSGEVCLLNRLPQSAGNVLKNISHNRFPSSACGQNGPRGGSGMTPLAVSRGARDTPYQQQRYSTWRGNLRQETTPSQVRVRVLRRHLRAASPSGGLSFPHTFTAPVLTIAVGGHIIDRDVRIHLWS